MHERQKKTTAFQSLAVFFENKTESHFKSTKTLKNDHDNYILLSILKFDTRMNHFINEFVDKKKYVTVIEFIDTDRHEIDIHSNFVNGNKLEKKCPTTAIQSEKIIKLTHFKI